LVVHYQRFDIIHSSVATYSFGEWSVILPVLASVRHSARSQRIANLVFNAVELEQGFLKPSIDGI
jgi:hypothetical protein